MTYSTGYLSHAGGRPYNEDAMGMCSTADGLTCWVVCDGLGGHGGGEVASQAAVEILLDAFEQAPRIAPEALEQYVEAAQAMLLERQQESESLAAMRTTVVVLLTDPQQALWGHVGDSRLYHLRAGRIIAQTRDHSVPQAMVAAGDLKADEIRRHEDRSRLLRSLGQPGQARPTLLDEPVPLEPGDALLLCSDGFWECVYETEMEVDFAKAATPDAWIAAMHERLRSRMPADHDNYTALAVFVMEN